MGGHVPQARQMLRQLFPDQILCEPTEVDGHLGYRFEATGTYGRLLLGEALDLSKGLAVANGP